MNAGSYFQDLFGAKWSTITTVPELSLLNLITVDTTPPSALGVNCYNPDGVYHPGQSLFLYINFDKPVLVLGETPKLGLRFAFEPAMVPANTPDKDLLAIYTGGNETSTLTFRYDIPSALVGFSPLANSVMQLVYAETNALAINSKGTGFFKIVYYIIII